MYLRIRSEEAGNPETAKSADKKNPNKSLFSLLSQRTRNGAAQQDRNLSDTNHCTPAKHTTENCGPTTPRQQRPSGEATSSPLWRSTHIPSRGKSEGQEGEPGLSCQQTSETGQPCVTEDTTEPGLPTYYININGISLKTKHAATIWPSNRTPRHAAKLFSRMALPFTVNCFMSTP